MGLRDLPARADGGAWNVVVETPRGSRVKLEYDREADVFTVSRPLILGLAYPYDWGFVPSTEADDGDPMDAMLLWEIPTTPGLVVPAHPIGFLALDQKGDGGRRERNDRVLFVAEGDERTPWRDVREIPKRVRDELAAFFRNVTTFTEKDVRVLGWKNAKAAEALLRKSVVSE